MPTWILHRINLKVINSGGGGGGGGKKQKKKL